MDDKTLQKKLNQMVRLGNELDKEAKRRYGRDAMLFHEADGTLMIVRSGSSARRGLTEFDAPLVADGCVCWGAGAA